jgi:peptidoglycan/LPS O-acetylase OafA/YrhL
MIAWIGCYSYSIYLWHLDLGRAPIRWLVHHTFLSAIPPELGWSIAMGLFVGLACLVGAVLGRLVEIPALTLRNRLFPARADAIASMPKTTVAG